MFDKCEDERVFGTYASTSESVEWLSPTWGAMVFQRSIPRQRYAWHVKPIFEEGSPPARYFRKHPTGSSVRMMLANLSGPGRFEH